MNYEEMTDAELSLEVGKRVIPQYNSYMIADGKAIFDTNADYRFVSFDINNWGDIGPVIEEYNIGLNKFNSDDINWTADVEHPKACDEYNIIEVENENPKRAAAICFLKMMEI